MKRKFLCIVCVLSIVTVANSVQAQWTKASLFAGAGTIHALAASGTTLFAGTDAGGIYRSTDNGVSWTEANTGLTKLNIRSFAVTSGSIFCLTGDGIYRSDNGGTSWIQRNAGLPSLAITSMVASGTTVFVGVGTGIVGGEGTNGGIFGLYDMDTAWTASAPMLKNTHFSVSIALAISGDTVYAGIFSNAVQWSTDNGKTWVNRNTGLPTSLISGLIRCGSNMFANPVGWGDYLSTDNGNSWSEAHTDPSIFTFNCIASFGPTIFGGTSSGVSVSTTNGASWSLKSTGLPTTGINSLLVNGNDLFAGTSDGEVWRRPLSEMITGVNNDQSQIPNDYALEQNYPNPFNPSTTISFSLPSKEFVTVKIFDVMGRDVATVASEEMPAGTYQRQWNAQGQPSGVYFYRMQAGGYTATKRLVILK
jgi:hypothetical protein